jgi:flagellar biosynthesis/type III secretory pathway chaperone
LQSQDLSKLVDILTQEVDLLRKLHSALVDEQNALVRGDVEGIKQKVERQIEAIKSIAGLEEERRAAFKSICPGQAPDSEIDFETVVGFAGPEEAGHLDNIRSSMREVLKSLGEVNRQNDVLIRQSLSYVRRTLRALAGENAGSEVYTSRGALRSATGQIAVDRKA